jgi:polyisoprenoid-binding protein YceI
MKRLFFVLFVSTCALQLSAQKIFTKTAAVKFSANSNLEKIEGNTNTASTAIDKSTGNIEFALLVKSLKFEKALMEEHFNENYMESSKFPKATFKGKIVNFDASKISVKKMEYDLEGDLTIHGVTKKVKTKIVLVLNGGKLSVASNLVVKAKDYNIAIPSLVKSKIAEDIDITIKLVLEAK